MKLLGKTICLAGLFLILFCVWQCNAEIGSYTEQEVKAAFIFNFARFIEWPQPKTDQTDNSIKIIVVGDYTACKTLKGLNTKKINERKIEVRIFKRYRDIHDPNVLKNSDVLFITASQRKHTEQILKTIKGSSILSIGEDSNFLQSGGIINFVKKDQKIRFEINERMAENEKLVINSKLLKLAIRVISKSEGK